jgi:hypothetical protein
VFDVLIGIIFFAHVIIVLAYLGIGFYVWPKFDAAGPGWGVQAARLSGQVFFLTCAYTHAHDGWHILTQTPIVSNIDTWHYMGAHVLQALSAPLALFFGWKYTTLRFVTPELSRMLDRMTVESHKRLTELKNGKKE